MDQNTSTTSISPSFDDVVAEYKNTAEHNDQLYRLMTTLTWNEPCLSMHRRYIEENELGFGDPAFHAMWLRLMDKANKRFGTVRALEIWSL